MRVVRLLICLSVIAVIVFTVSGCGASTPQAQIRGTLVAWSNSTANGNVKPCSVLSHSLLELELRYYGYASCDSTRRLLLPFPHIHLDDERIFINDNTATVDALEVYPNGHTQRRVFELQHEHGKWVITNVH